MYICTYERRLYFYNQNQKLIIYCSFCSKFCEYASCHTHTCTSSYRCNVRKLASYTAGPKSDQDVFPDKVECQSCCKGMCRFHSPFQVVQIFTKLVEELNGIGGRYKSPTGMLNDDLLLRFSIFQYGVQQVTYKYYLMTSAIFRGGRQPALHQMLNWKFWKGKIQEILFSKLCSSLMFLRANHGHVQSTGGQMNYLDAQRHFQLRNLQPDCAK